MHAEVTQECGTLRTALQKTKADLTGFNRRATDIEIRSNWGLMVSKHPGHQGLSAVAQPAQPKGALYLLVLAPRLPRLLHQWFACSYPLGHQLLSLFDQGSIGRLEDQISYPDSAYAFVSSPDQASARASRSDSTMAAQHFNGNLDGHVRPFDEILIARLS